MDYYTILAQRKQLAETFAGCRPDTVRRLDKYSLFIGFDSARALKLDCTPDMPYVQTIDKQYMPVKKAQNWFPKTLAGIVLNSIDIIPGDRVLTFNFDSGIRLIFEMTGRHANIILVDEDNVILGSLRKITSRHSGVREVRPGAEYIPPPARSFPDPLWSPYQTLKRLLTAQDSTVRDALANSIAAGSRIFAEEACSRAGIDCGANAAGLDETDILRLLKTVAEMAAAIERGGDGAVIIENDEGLPRDVFPLEMQSRPEARTFEDIDSAVERYSLERERGLDRTSLKKSIETSLNREEKGLVNTLDKVRRERGTLSEPEELERKGNTVLAHIHLLDKGMTTFAADDPYGGGKLDIELDPKLDGPANAERYFSRARKLKEAAKRAGERIADLESRIAEVRAERKRIEDIEDLKTLKKLAAEHARKASASGGEDSDRPFPRRFTSSAGLEIIVGRNDKENDELLKWANRNDLWLHAQNVGGSHVILRTPGRNQQPDRRSIEEAAAVAAYYSKMKTSSLAPVACTQLKYVVKRRGQGPGQVTYTRESVVFVPPRLPGK